MNRPRIALVVPALAASAGVGSVASFLLKTIKRKPHYELKLISLAMSSADPCSVLLHRPATWIRGISVQEGIYQGEKFYHVGALGGEIETQRLKPRAALSAIIADCDLIQVVAGVPSWSLPVVGLDKPVVLQVATLTAVERRRRQEVEHGPLALWRRFMTRRVANLDRQALGLVDAVMVENPWMLNYARQLLKSHSTIVEYAPPGLDLAEFTPLAERSFSSPYILCVGRLADARKNVGLLLDAYAGLCRALVDAPRLVLAGLSPPPEFFWRRAETLGVLEHIEFVSRPSSAELRRLYRDASIFASSSDEEGFGVAILEAMASGVPVVSTRSGGPEGIVTDGCDGFLVPTGDSDAMTARLILLMKDAVLNLRMGRAARATAENRFEQNIAGDRYLEVYDRLLYRRDKRCRD